MKHPSPWFSVFRAAANSSMRLYCFPHAGGGATTYRHWPLPMGPEVEVWAVSPPGRDRRLQEEPLAQMERLVHELAAAMRSDLDVPFAFFGHSGGALVAFELARLLRREEGVELQHLFVSASAAPHLESRKLFAGRLSDAEVLAIVTDKLGTIPTELARERDLMDLFMPALRADLELLERYGYRAEMPLGCPITAFCGTDDPIVRKWEVEGWREHTSGPFETVELSGDHFFISAERDEVTRLVRSAVLGNLAQALP